MKAELQAIKERLDVIDPAARSIESEVCELRDCVVLLLQFVNNTFR